MPSIAQNPCAPGSHKPAREPNAPPRINSGASTPPDVPDARPLFPPKQDRESTAEVRKPRQESPPEENWIQQNEDWI